MRFLGRRLLFVVLLSVTVSGCVTVANTLRRDDVASFKLSDVSVKFAPDTRINWHDGIRDYATAKNIPDHELAAATTSDEAKGHVQGLVATKVKTAMQNQVAGSLKGARPVRIEVVVLNVEISSAVQRILIGGGFSIVADVNLLDAKTGATIIAYPKLVYALPAGQGVLGTAVQAAYDAATAPPIDRVVNGHAETFRNWLMPKQTS
jgi:hypothetical protein